MPYKDYQEHLRRAKERYANDPEFRARKQEIAKRNYDPEKAHRRGVLYRYGLRFYDELLSIQNGKCAFCGQEPDPESSKHYRLSVDHDHKTGRIRGLLCFSCNAKLGWFENRKDKILEYLKEPE